MRFGPAVHGDDQLLSELQERNQALEQANQELRRKTEFQAALGSVARALGESLSLDEVVESVATRSVELTRAFGAYIERVEAIGPEGSVEIVAVAGKGVPPVGTRAPYPGSLTEEIIETGEPRTIAEVGALGESMAPYIRERCRRCSGLIVPLRSAGESLGALVLFRGPDQEPFTSDEATFVRALGDIASTALRRVLLLEELRQDVAERKRLADRTALLGEASRILASSLEFDETLNRVARLAVPALGDYCVIDVLENNGELRRTGIAHRDPVKEAAIRAQGRYAPDWKSRSPAIEALRTVSPQIVPEMDEFWTEVTGQSPEHRRLIRYLAPRSAIVAPLHARERVLGVFWLVWSESNRRYDTEDLVLVDEIARRTSGFIENSRLFQETRAARLEAERRAAREEALRKAAAAVGAAQTIDEMVRQIAQSALTSTGADRVVVEQIDWERGEVEVTATAGEQTLPTGGRMKYAGSLAELIVERDQPEIIQVLTGANERISRELRDACCECRVLAVPLKDPEETVGVLILLRGPGQEPFRREEVDHASVFADLATLAFRKVRLLEQAEQQRDELARVMESRSRLARGFSHDVKNPLGAADGYLQLLEDGVFGPISDKQKESITRARRSIGSALRLIVDLTELARAESATIEIAREPVDLGQVVRDVVEEYRAGAESKGLTIETAVPDELPIIQSDAMRVRQVLGNLLSNAIKYTKRGGITVRCAIDATGIPACPAPCQRIDVSDTGPGIPPEAQEKLFREFTRLDGGGVAPGAGIGLAISRKIAEMLGGTLTVTSEVDVGSTFTLWLPRRNGP